MAKATTVVLSGPVSRRTQALAMLERLGAKIEPHTRQTRSQGLPEDDPKLDWVTCSVDDIDDLAKVPAGWRLRLHWPTPKCLGCSGVGKVGAVACQRCNGSGASNNNVKQIAGGSQESPGWAISADQHQAYAVRMAQQALLAGSGVVGNPFSLVTAPVSGMTVNVAAFVGWIPGTLGYTAGMQTNAGAQTAYGYPSTFTTQGCYSGYNDATTSLSIATADPTHPRIDLVCQSAQDAEYAGTNNQLVLQVVTGTAADSPVPPTAPASSIVLAQVEVAATALNILTGDITNEASSVDTGWVTPTFVNGWSSIGSPYRAVAYRLVGDIVMFQGLIGTGTPSTVAFYLPTIMSPTGTVEQYFNGYPVTVTSGGAVSLGAGASVYPLDGYWFSILP